MIQIMNTIQNSSFAAARFFFSDTRSASFWLLVRLYIGWIWLSAGWEKASNPAWFGSDAGASINGFVLGALAKTTGAHPDVQGWYASFLMHVMLPHPMAWANAITLGEILVGLGLIVGLFTAAAAFFGFFMNMNFLLAGTVSVNPVMLLCAIGLMCAHRVAGYWGLDRFAKRWYRKTSAGPLTS